MPREVMHWLPLLHGMPSWGPLAAHVAKLCYAYAQQHTEATPPNATGLFHAEAGGSSSVAAVKGRVLAQAEAASEETGVERAVKRALRGVADLVRWGEGLLHILSEKESKHEACMESMAVRQALCRAVDGPQCDCARMPLRCNAHADFAGACLQGRRVWALPGNGSVSGAATLTSHEAHDEALWAGRSCCGARRCTM